jgi:hypothetical protein
MTLTKEFLTHEIAQSSHLLGPTCVKTHLHLFTIRPLSQQRYHIRTNIHRHTYPPLPKTSQLFPRTPVCHPLAITYHGHTLRSKQITNINTTLKHYSHHVRQRRHEDWFWLDRQGACISFPTLPFSPPSLRTKRLTRRKTNKQLTYLFALIENSNVKFDYNVRSQCLHFPSFAHPTHSPSCHKIHRQLT